MEDFYDFDRHTYRVCIYLKETEVYIRFFGNLYNIYTPRIPLRCEANIIYNRQKTDVIAWGTRKNLELNEDCILYDNFRNRLYHLFKKGKHDWDEDDFFFIEAVSQFIKLMIKKKMEENQKAAYIKSLDSLQYAFIVPSEWEIEIREILIRPIFIKANLISENDHKARLLFASDLESICYALQTKRINNTFLMKGQNTIICRCKFVDKEAALIEVDLVETTNKLYDLPFSIFIPKIIHSNFFFITSATIKRGIRKYLKQNSRLSREGARQNMDIEMLVDNIYIRRYRMVEETKSYDLIHSEEGGPNNSQMMFLSFINPFDICSMIDQDLLDMIKSMCSKNLVKKYKLFVIGEYPFFDTSVISSSLTQWIQIIIYYNMYSLENIVSLDIKELKFTDLNVEQLISGISAYVGRTIQNSYMFCKPNTIPNKIQTTPSSIFKNSKPGAILSIDISLKSTLLSYSILNDDGFVVEIFDHNYLTTDKSLPSFESFYHHSTSKAKKQFTSFAENYIWDGSKSVCVYKDFLFQIEVTLKESYFKEHYRNSNPQNEYIQAFLIMYFIYIEDMISNKLKAHNKPKEAVSQKIGYAISVELMLLNTLIGSKENLRNLLYTSGLISEYDESKKLRIITKGEEVLSLIQPLFKLEFPIRSCFVLAQLHDSYIQITLNQVVTSLTLKDEQQEAIILADSIIPIQNIYESLCMNMWNNLIQNQNLIQLCSIHTRHNSEDEISELFSLSTKIIFDAKFKRHILKSILSSDSDLKNFDKISFKMNHSCNCRVKLTLNDVVEIAFRPLLKDINSVSMGSLLNVDIVGGCTNIDYHFSLIHFNHNKKLLNIIINILRENCEEFNPWHGINAKCMVIPELPTKIFQSTLNLQPYQYKGFLIGTFQQVVTENYAVYIYKSDGSGLNVMNGYGKDRGVVYVEGEGEKFFPFLQKGEILKNGCPMITKFYVKPFFPDDKPIYFDLYTYKTSGPLNREGTITSADKTWTKLTGFSFSLKKYYDPSYVLAVAITFEPRSFFGQSTILFREVGEYTVTENNLGFSTYAMTLSRF